jgi:hypothetical protein
MKEFRRARDEIKEKIQLFLNDTGEFLQAREQAECVKKQLQ